MAITLHTAALSDADDIASLLGASWADTYGSLLTPDQLSAVAREWHHPDGLRRQISDPRIGFLLARTDTGVLVGVATVRLSDDGATVSVLRLYVLPEHQGLGIGSQLLDRALAAFPPTPRIELQVAEGNPAGLSFWVKRGFRACGHDEARIGDLTLALISMERTVDASSETVDEYKGRILGYQAGADPLVLQAKAPDVLAALVEGLSAEQLDQRPVPGKWSIREIVAHLADDELVGAYRIRLILSVPGTAIQAFDQDVWARTGRYGTLDISDSLALYRTLRFANLKLLQSLTAQEWDLSGVHAERGIESLRDIARYFAGHDINHFRQIESIRRRLETMRNC